MTELKQIFSDNLKFYREKRALSQAGLARRTGTKQNSICRFEKGVNEPSFLLIERLSIALEIEPTELFKKRFS